MDRRLAELNEVEKHVHHTILDTTEILLRAIDTLEEEEFIIHPDAIDALKRKAIDLTDDVNSLVYRGDSEQYDQE